MLKTKFARRQAYRYGQQVRALTNNGQQDAAQAVENAYQTFITQFDSVDHEVTKNWLEDEYRRGLDDLDPLTVLVRM